MNSYLQPPRDINKCSFFLHLRTKWFKTVEQFFFLLGRQGWGVVRDPKTCYRVYSNVVVQSQSTNKTVFCVLQQTVVKHVVAHCNLRPGARSPLPHHWSGHGGGRENIYYYRLRVCLRFPDVACTHLATIVVFHDRRSTRTNTSPFRRHRRLFHFTRTHLVSTRRSFHNSDGKRRLFTALLTRTDVSDVTVRRRIKWSWS